MAETLKSLNEIAREMNAAFVKAGKPDWRREFNTRLWACNRDSALKVIEEYRGRLGDVAKAFYWRDGERRLVSSQRS
jgi:hypothetical protein